MTLYLVFKHLSLTRPFSIIASFNPKAFHFCCLTNERILLIYRLATLLLGLTRGPSVFLHLLYRAHKGLKCIWNHTQHTPAVSVTREAEEDCLGLDFEPIEASHDEFREITLSYRGRKSDPPPHTHTHPRVSHPQIQSKSRQKKKS